MQDVYNGLEPDVKRGEIKQIAVVQEIEKSTHTPQNNQRLDGPGMRNIAVFGFQFPLVSCGATYAPKKVWGFADVSEDGSAAFQVPSEVPIYFLALDGEGRALQRMRSFTHLMPGEVQGCVGCHADRNSVAPHSGQRTGDPRLGPGTPAARLGRQGIQLPGGRPGRVRPELHRVPQRTRASRQRRPDRRHDRFLQRLVRRPLPDRDAGRAELDPARQPLGAGVRPRPRHEPLHRVDLDDQRRGAQRAGNRAAALGQPGQQAGRDHPHRDTRTKTASRRVDVPDEDRRRVYLWLDLNVPYYGTSSSNHKARLGSRRMMPLDLDSTLDEVASRRCASCHQAGIPRKFYTRVMNPENNSFLLAPLAEAAGGTQKCSQAVFQSKDDPDYQKILQTFAPIHQLLKERPRADMPEFQFICD